MSFSSKVASPSKNQVTETVLDILVRVTGVVERETVSGATNPAMDLRIDTDDLSVFIAEVEKRFTTAYLATELSGSATREAAAALAAEVGARHLETAIQEAVECYRTQGLPARLHLTGATDPRGTEEYNIALGDRRAQAVRAYLVSLGIDGGRIGVSSVGEEMAQGSDEAGWAQDRAVSAE